MNALRLCHEGERSRPCVRVVECTVCGVQARLFGRREVPKGWTTDGQGPDRILACSHCDASEVDYARAS